MDGSRNLRGPPVAVSFRSSVQRGVSTRTGSVDGVCPTGRAAAAAGPLRRGMRTGQYHVGARTHGSLGTLGRAIAGLKSVADTADHPPSRRAETILVVIVV